METYVHKVFIKEEKNLNMLPEDEEDLKEDTELFENSLSSPTNIKSELQDEGTFLNVANLKEECPNSFSEDENQCPNEAIQQDKESALKVECMHLENNILPVQVKLEISNSNCIHASDTSWILPTEEQETNNFSDECKVTSSMWSDGGEKEYTRPEEQLPDVVLSCTYCGLMFFSSLSLSQHEQVCKNNNQSSEIYIEHSQSKNHHNKHLTDEKLTLCEVCNKTFTRRSGLMRHIKSVHEKQRIYKCDLCTISFAELSNLKCHMRSHNKEKPFSCRICDTKFASSSGLKRHSRIHTGDKPYICSTCDKSFTSSTSLNKHTKIHTGDKPHSCSTCNKKFISKGHLAEHVRSHTGEKPFSCSLCDKKFSRSSHIAQHMSLHTNEKPFSYVVLSCTYCGLMFFSSLSLSQHEQVCKNNIQSSEIYIEDSQSKNHHNKYLGVNTDEKLILCEICHKTFTRRSGLRQHINSVHEKQRTYKCDLCNISFAWLSNLKGHMRSHNKEKPFSCRICDTKFASSSGLKRHSRIHTGDKPYICNTCDKSFTSSTSLNKHTKIHTGDKPHSCSTCNKKFISKGHLAEHVRSHTGEKPFSCSLCDKKFRRRSHIAEHMSLHTNKKTTFL